MKYEIYIPIEIPEDYFNIGIDFSPMTITGVKRGSNVDETLINLKQLCISLDNRYLKSYKILRNEGMTVIEIDV
jgi:hypothetical protein